MKDSAPFSIDIIRSDARSVGDAMRDLDQKQLIAGDFICVYGDVVSNVPLEAALTAHRNRREKNKKAIMTMVLREAGTSHRTKSHNLRPVFVLDPVAHRCVHYEQVRPGETSRLDISEEVLNEHPEVEVREDLIDPGIDICTPEVLAQYTDNFDWQAPRRGFLYGVLKDYETNLLMIFTGTDHPFFPPLDGQEKEWLSVTLNTKAVKSAFGDQADAVMGENAVFIVP